MSNDRFRADRESVLFHSKRMWEAGLVVASAGNVSARVSGQNAIAITPTSVSYDVMTADQVVVVSLDSGLPIESKVRPSAELPTHLAVYRYRQDVGAVVHTHAPYVTTLSVLRRPLPPVIDEMIVYFGGTIEVADYAFTGTDDLGANVVVALGDRQPGQHPAIERGPISPATLFMADSIDMPAWTQMSNRSSESGNTRLMDF